MTDTTVSPDASANVPTQAPIDPSVGVTPARMRLRQALAVMRIHTRRTLLSRRGLALYLLVLMPVGMLTIRLVMLTLLARPRTIGGTTLEFAGFSLFLGLLVYFGAATVFSNAVRREVLERTLHFYFLMPVRRGVLMAGLYLGGVVAMGVVIAVTTVVTFVLYYLPVGAGAFAQYLFQGPGLGHLAGYLLLMLVAVAGYGAVFFTLGLFLRRPALAVIGIFGWELLVPLLPPLLKRISISYYLGALMPVPVSGGAFTVLAQYPAPWAAVLGLLIVIAALLTLAGWKAGRLEILYGED